MRKLVCVIFITVIVMGAIHLNSHYTRKNCSVIAVTNNSAIIQDRVGHLWEFKTANLKISDVVDLKMYDNKTAKDIKDDIIIEVIKK